MQPTHEPAAKVVATPEPGDGAADVVAPDGMIAAFAAEPEVTPEA